MRAQDFSFYCKNNNKKKKKFPLIPNPLNQTFRCSRTQCRRGVKRGVAFIDWRFMSMGKWAVYLDSEPLFPFLMAHHPCPKIRSPRIPLTLCIHSLLNFANNVVHPLLKIHTHF
ncbi:hypothetical protein CEXT_701711 [Caerostris extrusa]|uniref:Uncharacterized protein n=1 Tax=Caerostris extrusa TaxID=172846 RepID=A0AAV4X251_CAEEX|nr:hypothetical protein CEXT_701711 [Caerostris extrusa]